MSDTSTPAPAPGWYADPQNSSQIRYWDGVQWTSQVRPLPVQQTPVQAAQAPVQAAQTPTEYSGPPVQVVTSDQIPGYRISKVIGQVCGVNVRVKNTYSNVGASFRGFVGGEAEGYAAMLLESRKDAIGRLKSAAAAAGGNAVVAMRYDSGDIANLMSEVAAYGTAVVVEPE